MTFTGSHVSGCARLNAPQTTSSTWVWWLCSGEQRSWGLGVGRACGQILGRSDPHRRDPNRSPIPSSFDRSHHHHHAPRRRRRSRPLVDAMSQPVSRRERRAARVVARGITPIKSRNRIHTTINPSMVSHQAQTHRQQTDGRTDGEAAGKVSICGPVRGPRNRQLHAACDAATWVESPPTRTHGASRRASRWGFDPVTAKGVD